MTTMFILHDNVECSHNEYPTSSGVHAIVATVDGHDGYHARSMQHTHSETEQPVLYIEVQTEGGTLTLDATGARHLCDTLRYLLVTRVGHVTPREEPF